MAPAIDDASLDVNYLNVLLGASASVRGASDFDVRQTYSSAVSYNIFTLALRVRAAAPGNRYLAIGRPIPWFMLVPLRR